MPQIIDGRAIARQIQDECREKTAALAVRGIVPCLAVVIVGDDPASHIYVRNKKKTCADIGIASLSYELPADTGEAELLSLIGQLNGDGAVTAILVQLPLPAHIDEGRVMAAIDPAKDVDCFHPMNVGKLALGRPAYLPATPAGIVEVLKRSQIAISGSECVIIGRSNIVGKPMALLMLRENATVTVCHTKTVNLAAVCRRADILIVAAGCAKMVTAEYVKEGAVVIDVGMHRGEDGKLCGDVDFDSVAPICSAITPVPGGIGPMTIAMLMSNCLRGYDDLSQMRI